MNVSFIVERYNIAMKKGDIFSAQVLWTRLVNMGYKMENNNEKKSRR